MKSILCTVLLLSLLPGRVAAVDLAGDKQKFSYALGTQIARNVGQQGVEIDAEAFAAGVRDVLNDNELQLTEEQMQQAAENYKQELDAKREVEGAQNSKAGTAFRAKNKQQSDVKELDNGIQYKVLKEGSGDQPAPDDTVVVHYRGTLVNGEEFDSSYERNEPTTFKVNEVIQGWQTILPMMQERAQWQVVIPPELAYGKRGAGSVIGPNETLIFDIELLEIK